MAALLLPFSAHAMDATLLTLTSVYLTENTKAQQKDHEEMKAEAQASLEEKEQQE